MYPPNTNEIMCSLFLTLIRIIQILQYQIIKIYSLYQLQSLLVLVSSLRGYSSQCFPLVSIFEALEFFFVFLNYLYPLLEFSNYSLVFSNHLLILCLDSFILIFKLLHFLPIECFCIFNFFLDRNKFVLIFFQRLFILVHTIFLYLTVHMQILIPHLMIIVDAIILDRTNNQIKIEVSISMFIGLEF